MLRKIAMLCAVALVFGSSVYGGRSAGAFLQWVNTPAPVAYGDRSALLQRADADLVLFSLSTCPFCKQARAWLEQHHVPFKELVIDSTPSAERLFDELKEQGLPVLVMQDRLIRGFNAEAYAEAMLGAGGPSVAANSSTH